MKTSEGQDVRVMWTWIDGQRKAIVDTHDYAKLSKYKQQYVKQMCDEGKLIAIKYNGRWWIFVKAFYNTSGGDVTWHVKIS